MDTKLTLKLNENIIERAKKYASRRKISLSRLVENYLDTVSQEQKDDFEISPFIKSISSGKSIPVDIDDRQIKEGYIDFLDKKYQ